MAAPTQGPRGVGDARSVSLGPGRTAIIFGPGSLLVAERGDTFQLDERAMKRLVAAWLAWEWDRRGQLPAEVQAVLDSLRAQDGTGAAEPAEVAPAAT